VSASLPDGKHKAVTRGFRSSTGGEGKKQTNRNGRTVVEEGPESGQPTRWEAKEKGDDSGVDKERSRSLVDDTR